jgi:hypothetical protein
MNTKSTSINNKVAVCSDCPCRNRDICLKAGFKNSEEFGINLRKAIAIAEQYKLSMKV